MVSTVTKATIVTTGLGGLGVVQLVAVPPPISGAPVSAVTPHEIPDGVVDPCGQYEFSSAVQSRQVAEPIVLYLPAGHSTPGLYTVEPGAHQRPALQFEQDDDPPEEEEEEEEEKKEEEEEEEKEEEEEEEEKEEEEEEQQQEEEEEEDDEKKNGKK